MRGYANKMYNIPVKITQCLPNLYYPQSNIYANKNMLPNLIYLTFFSKLCYWNPTINFIWPHPSVRNLSTEHKHCTDTREHFSFCSFI